MSAEIEVPHGNTCEEEKAKHTESANGLLPGEHADIVKDVQELIPDAEVWLDTPNVHFDGGKPRDAIGTDANGLWPYPSFRQIRIGFMNLAGCPALTTAPERRVWYRAYFAS